MEAGRQSCWFWKATAGNSEQAFLIGFSHFKQFAAGKEDLPYLYSGAFSLTHPPERTRLGASYCPNRSLKAFLAPNQYFVIFAMHVIMCEILIF